MMTRQIRAHFDGKVIVPDEPVDWPVDSPLHVQVTSRPSDNGGVPPDIIEERLRRLASATGCLSGPSLPPAALSRESIYDERP